MLCQAQVSTGNRSWREWVHISGRGINVKSGEGRKDGERGRYICW